MSCWVALSAQPGNPFELRQRQVVAQDTLSLGSVAATNPFEKAGAPVATGSRPITTIVPTVDTLSDEAAVSPNPFEKTPTTRPPMVTAAPTVPDAAPALPATPRRDLTARRATPTDAASQRVVLIMLSSLVVLLTLIITLFRSYIGQVMQALTDDSVLASLFRMRNSVHLVQSIVLNVFFILSLGVFAFLLFDYWERIPVGRPWAMFLRCLLIVGAIWLSKQVILRLIRWVFPVGKMADRYLFLIDIMNKAIGILLVPLSLLVAFGDATVAYYALWATLVVLVLIYAYRSAKGLIISSGSIASYPFHYIMYLCAIEIAPVVILVKLLGFS